MSGLEQDFRILERASSASKTEAVRQTQSGDHTQTETRRAWSLPGVYAGTRISTSFGEVPAHLIRVKDQLRTRDGSFMRVLRIDEYKLDAEFLADHPEARPIAFSPGKDAKASVFLSPGQRMLARSASGRETLRRASEFKSQPGVVPTTSGPFSYFVFHLGKAALVRAEGMWISIGD